jgi:protein gp37
MSKRFAGRFGYPADNPFRVTLHPDRLEQPFHWRKPRKIFVVSMGDLFHEDVPFSYIASVYGVMAACPQHTFMVLTKRPGRAGKWYAWKAAGGSLDASSVPYAALRSQGVSAGFLRNVMVGITAENQQCADERLPLLFDIPAASRFVSCEPMLSAIDLRRIQTDGTLIKGHRVMRFFRGRSDIGIDLVLAGAESGPGARPMHLDWVRELRDWCLEAEVPYFLKQADLGFGLEKMPALDGRTWAQMPKEIV